jgi:hypothetical protein
LRPDRSDLARQGLELHARGQFGADRDRNPEILNRTDFVALDALANSINNALVVGTGLSIVRGLAARRGAVIGRLRAGRSALRRIRALRIDAGPLLIVLPRCRLRRVRSSWPIVRPQRLRRVRRSRGAIVGLSLLGRLAAIAVVLPLALGLVALLLLLGARVRSLVRALALRLFSFASLARAALRVLARLNFTAF